MVIKPSWRPRTDELTKKIYALVPKKSSSYSLASSKLLEILFLEKIRAEVTIVYFDNDLESGKAFFKEAEANGVDLIFSMGSESADLVHSYYKGRSIPVVTCTNKDPVLLGQMANYTEGSHTNIATTSLNVQLDIQLNYLLDLIPGLKNIGLMYDENHKQVVATEVVPAKQEFLKNRLNVIDVAVQSSDTAKETLSRIMPDVIRRMRESDPTLQKSVFWITSATSVFSEIETINRHADKVPVVSSIPNVVQAGDNSAVLAIGIDRRNNAHLAAIYASRILKGEVKAGDLKVGVVSPPDVAINFRVAKRIGLKIPFRFFESAAFIYDYDGVLVRSFGENIVKQER
jgi:putative ABC transport system substrate-binding protein